MWHGDLTILHHLYPTLYANGIPNFKRSHFVGKTQFNGAVNGIGRIGNFRDAAGGIRQHWQGGLDDILPTAIILPAVVVENLVEAGWQFHVLRLANHSKTRLGRRLIGHRLQIQRPKLLALVLFNDGFIKTLIGFVAQPFVFDHLLHQFGQFEDVAAFVVWHKVIQIGRYVPRDIVAYDVT